MREYPHGLDEEILPEDLEIEQDIINQLEIHVERGYAERKSSLFRGLGKSYFAVGCCSYALGEAPFKIAEPLRKALEYLYTSFDFGYPQQAYDFIRLLTLAVVLENSEIAGSLARTKQERYTNENVEVEEITFIVAELISAFVRKDEETVGKILAENNPDKIEANKIFRYDRMLYLPLLPLLNAVHKKDSAGFSAALQARETDFVKFFSRAERKNDPDALIDIPGLAITAIARERGLDFTDRSVYRPSELIKERNS